MGVLYLLAVALLFLFELLHVIVDLFLLLIEDLVLLEVFSTILLLVFQIAIDVFDVPLVRFNHSFDLSNLFLLLLSLSVVLFDPVHQPLTSLGEWQIHLVSLQFQIFLFLYKLDLFFTEVLSALLEGILLQPVFELCQLLVDIVEFLAVYLNFVVQPVVFALKLLILIALLRIKIIQTSFVSVIDFLNLLLIAGKLIFHILFLGEQGVQMVLLFLILVADVDVQIFDVFGFGVAAVFVESQVVIGQFAFKLADILDQHLITALESQVLGIIAVDVIDFTFHLRDFIGDFIVLVLHEI